jgi:hypothetical protein
VIGSFGPNNEGGRREQLGDHPAGDPVRAEAGRLSAQAAEAGLHLRLIGSLGVREHCLATEQVLDALGRDPAHDIDYVAPAREEKAIVALFKGLAYQPDPAVAYSREYGIQRLIYHHPSAPVKVDIFLDVLHMSHTIDFRNRLPDGEVTVTLADLLLAKLQIHEVTEKDLQDLIAILGVHPLGVGDRETIDLAYLRGLLSQDWGLHYTAIGNLDRMTAFLNGQTHLPESVKELAHADVQRLTSEVELAPKSLRWRARAALGPRVRWYEEVEAVER